jgi:hypothetical protein
MKKLLIMIAMLSATAMATDRSFNVTLKLYKPITIDKVQDLLFPDATLTGSAFDIAVATSDTGAAAFNAQGGKNRSISSSIVESSISMSAPGVATSIAVDNFVVSAPTAFDNSGNANGIKVGATAHVLSNSEDGNYSGTATMRVVYN